MAASAWRCGANDPGAPHAAGSVFIFEMIRLRHGHHDDWLRKGRIVSNVIFAIEPSIVDAKDWTHPLVTLTTPPWISFPHNAPK